jgi:hypothetical protein
LKEPCANSSATSCRNHECKFNNLKAKWGNQCSPNYCITFSLSLPTWLTSVCTVHCTLYTAVQVHVYCNCTLTYILTFALMYAAWSMQGLQAERRLHCLQAFKKLWSLVTRFTREKAVNYQMYSVRTSSADQCTRLKGTVQRDGSGRKKEAFLHYPVDYDFRKNCFLR